MRFLSSAVVLYLIKGVKVIPCSDATITTIPNTIMSSNIFADLLANSLPRTSIDSASSDEDISTLPFPQPISRPVFSSPDFNTEQFLLSHAQFRTLDDLRSELRGWVDKLEREMETLIEEDWQGYLMLGRSLVGGETLVKDTEKRVRQVEREIKVTLLPTLLIQAAKQRIEERIREVDQVLLRKKRNREDAVCWSSRTTDIQNFARKLLAIHSALQSLERDLLLQTEDLDTLNDATSLYSMDRLSRLVSEYRELTYYIDRIPSQHPFLTSQGARIQKVKETLRKDFKDALATKRKEDNPSETFDLFRLIAKTDLGIPS